VALCSRLSIYGRLGLTKDLATMEKKTAAILLKKKSALKKQYIEIIDPKRIN